MPDQVELIIRDGRPVGVRIDGREIMADDDDDGDSPDPEKPGDVLTYLSKKINDRIPGGFLAEIKFIDADAYNKWREKKKKEKERNSFLAHLPDVMRMNFTDDMRQKLADVGAVQTAVDFDFRFAPLVTWKYQGEEYQAHFYLNGEFFEGKNWTLENADEHTFSSIIQKAIPEKRRRG